MQWLTRTPNFNFVKYRRVAMVTSTLLSLLAIVVIAYPGLNYGLDFTGGILVEARYSTVPPLDTIRSELSGAGFESVQVTGSGNDVLIRLPPPEGEDGAEPSTEAVAALRDRALEVLRGE
ncbi:MAG TPA: protein translocase subunit SecF, partial [Gammaproteobacteria bacterium]|nr:protein translocase subunit SecF [Gammaproteobacteria bacterium]